MAEFVRAETPDFGGAPGFGQVKLGLMHEILGTSPLAPLAFANAAPDSGNGEIIALAGTPEQKDRYLQGRIHHCMRWFGVARRPFDTLCERSLYRRAHGSTLSGHQSVQNWIADSAAETQAAGVDRGERRCRRGARRGDPHRQGHAGSPRPVPSRGPADV